MKPVCMSLYPFWREEAAPTSQSSWHWSGPHKIRITNPMSGRRGSASCAASLGTGVRRIRRTPVPSEAAHDAERSEEHTSELQSHLNLVCRLLLEKKKQKEYYRR